MSLCKRFMSSAQRCLLERMTDIMGDKKTAHSPGSRAEESPVLTHAVMKCEVELSWAYKARNLISNKKGNPNKKYSGYKTCTASKKIK